MTQVSVQYLEGGVQSSLESASFNFDVATGLLLKKIDINGHPMEFFYDDFYRPEFVVGPREIESGPFTVQYEYSDLTSLPSVLDENNLPWAIAHEYIGGTPSTSKLGDWNTSADYSLPNTTNVNVRQSVPVSMVNELRTNPDFSRTSVVTDGLGRVIQSKIETSAFNSLSDENEASILHSGWDVYDAWGGVRMSYRFLIDEGGDASTQPLKKLRIPDGDDVVISGRQLNKYGQVSEVHDLNSTVVNSEEYSVTVSNLSWVTDGQSQVIKSSTILYGDPTSYSNDYVNQFGQVYKSEIGDGADFSETTFEYDELDQLLSYTDSRGLQTLNSFDRQGRVWKEVNPDKGTMETVYDDAGNVVSISVNTNESRIDFEYEYGRLLHKRFLNDSQLDVHLTYGDASDNAVGRVVSVQVGDENGAKRLTDEYAYDEFGQTVREVRTIAVPWAGDYTFTSDYVYDSWGRLHHMRYPDGEVLTYGYTIKGDLENIKTNDTFLADFNSTYVKRIEYSPDGVAQKIIHGNGAVTEYTFDEKSRAMRSMKLSSSDNGISQTADVLTSSNYAYNASGNISSITNTGMLNGSIDLQGQGADYNGQNFYGIGGGSYQTFEYDAWNRLVDAKGAWKGSSETTSYELGMSYNHDGSINEKNQAVITNGVANTQLSYGLSYSTYSSSNHQLASAGETRDGINYTHSFIYDNRGNLTEHSVNGGRQTQTSKYLWDQVDRMVAASEDDDQMVQHNVYDADGIRIMKTIAQDNGIWEDNQKVGEDWTISPYIIYMGPHYVFQMFDDKVDVSKHYFGAGQRIATRMQIEDRYVAAMGEEPGPGPYFNDFNPDDPLGVGSPPSPHNNNVILAEWDDIFSWLLKSGLSSSELIAKGLSTYYGSPYYFHGECDLAQFDQGSWEYNYCECRKNISEAEAQGINCPQNYPHIFWYHSNYLGNTEYVTDLAGSPYEHFFYLPFGEVAVKQHVNNDGFSNPYKFSSAELDAEIGLSYFGARYYDSKFSMWLSVDPLKAERPMWTPYHFVRNNPIMFVDPTGLQEVTAEVGASENDLGPVNFYAFYYYLNEFPESVRSGGDGINYCNREGELVYVGRPHFTEDGTISYVVMQDPKTSRPDYVVLPESLGEFHTNIDRMKGLADIFYTNGVPDANMLEYMLAMRRGDMAGQLEAIGSMYQEDGVMFRTLLGSISAAGAGWQSRGVGNGISNVARRAWRFVRSPRAALARLSRSNRNAVHSVSAPEGWVSQPTRKGGGIVFKDPLNPHNSIRQMPGNPNSPNVLQQNPYVKFMKEGRFYDVNGNVLPNGNVPSAHIPLNQFDISRMPQF